MRFSSKSPKSQEVIFKCEICRWVCRVFIPKPNPSAADFTSELLENKNLQTLTQLNLLTQTRQLLLSCSIQAACLEVMFPQTERTSHCSSQLTLRLKHPEWLNTWEFRQGATLILAFSTVWFQQTSCNNVKVYCCKSFTCCCEGTVNSKQFVYKKVNFRVEFSIFDLNVQVNMLFKGAMCENVSLKQQRYQLKLAC